MNLDFCNKARYYTCNDLKHKRNVSKSVDQIVQGVIKMSGRNFSDVIQFGVVKSNLERHNGQIQCELCGKQIFSITECHFDHIIPYAKGGSSTLDNCQILCVECNLKKSDKELKDVILEEKAKQFLSGKSFLQDEKGTEGVKEIIDIQTENNNSKMTKEKFDAIVGKFIQEKGDIRQIDFNREYNHLPGISYVVKYYGTLNELKKAFGIVDISLNWNRENIKQALVSFVLAKGKITQKDIRKENGLPSINCILNYYPEYKNFTEIKRGLCDIDARGIWSREEALQAGKAFVSNNNGKLTQRDCSPDNNLPSLATIYRLFGDLPTYQREIGSVVSKNLFVPNEDVETAVNLYFKDRERVVESREKFFETFPYGIDVIRGRYSSFDKFATYFNIKVTKTKKAKYTKQEVDDIISEFVKHGNPIPHHHDLTKKGLPAANVIMRYYEHWREPFEMFQALYKKIGH